MMEKHELRAVTSLAAVFSVRMLGLFMVYPVFATFARRLVGVAARAASIDGMIVGRLLQGAGAIGSVVPALIADLTAEQSRT